MSESGKNRRDRAAAARDAATADERRRERMVRIIGGITVAVVVIGIIGVAVVARNSQSTDASASVPADPNAPLPAGVLASDDERAYGVPLGTAAADVPVLEIWEDFQCPACKSVEEANGAGIESLAESGTVQLVWRPSSFLDKNLGNDSSARATAAWGCAIDAGKAKEYHSTVFANQPEVEGTGYTTDQLIGFGSEAGITGADLETFTQCVNDATYLGWSANSTDVFYTSGIPGTPFALLDGVEVPTETLVDQAALEALVAAAAAGTTSPAASPSAS